MEYKIDASPDYSMLTIQIPKDEVLKVEASSMAAMDSHIKMKTRMKGGLKRFLSKESLFINEFKAENAPGEIMIAPGPSGDIAYKKLDGHEKFYLAASAFLASTTEVIQNTKWQGMGKGFFSGAGFFLIECSGVGDLWFNFYGAIFEVDVMDEYVVDTGHIVAFTEGLDYDISKIGGYKSLFFSGEGFVAKFRGQGKVWIQTKQPMGLVNWADQYRIVQRSND